MIIITKYDILLKKGFNMDIIYMLQQIKNNIKIPNNIRINNILKNMEQKGLITDNYRLTLEGNNLLEFISSPDNDNVILKKVTFEDSFTKWWNTYPATNTFEYKGRKFKGNRALRVKKEDCRLKINKILNENQYTIEDLIKALELEVYQKQESSYKENKNKMDYMQNSLTYLNQATYEAFIELVKQGYCAKKEEREQTTDTYI